MKSLSVLAVVISMFILSGCSQGGQPINKVSDSNDSSGKTVSDSKPAPDKGNNDVDVREPEQETVVVYVANENADGLVKKEVNRVKEARFDDAEILTLLSVPNTSPEGTKLLNLRIDKGQAVVDMNKEFESGGGTSSVTFRVAEIVFTLTERPDVDSVKIIIEGKEVEYITGEGFMVDKPLTRKDFPDLKID